MLSYHEKDNVLHVTTQRGETASELIRFCAVRGIDCQKEENGWVIGDNDGRIYFREDGESFWYELVILKVALNAERYNQDAVDSICDTFDAITKGLGRQTFNDINEGDWIIHFGMPAQVTKKTKYKFYYTTISGYKNSIHISEFPEGTKPYIKSCAADAGFAWQYYKVFRHYIMYGKKGISLKA